MITGPIIYSMIFPLLVLDLFVSFYQWSCFPIYGIPKLSRNDFIIFDRQELKYLDWISKFHCTYCAYGVGVVAFVGEVIGATESYFCPIKHKSEKRHGTHKRGRYVPFDKSINFDFNAYLAKARKKLPNSDKN
jgi:hypothetical protein